MLMKMQNIVFGEKPFAKQQIVYADENEERRFWREALRKTTISIILRQDEGDVQIAFFLGSP